MAKYILFVFNSILLGVGLAMDAFSVSLANGFIEPKMKKVRMSYMAGIYAGFQFIMPVIGWFLVHNAAQFFSGFQRFIPWIALILLSYIGGKMLFEGIKEKKCIRDGKCEGCDNKECPKYGAVVGENTLTTKLLLVQGVATSIDALSVGFTIADYNTLMAIGSATIIAVVTYVVCYMGIGLGKTFGTKLASNAKILGGVILIAIGLEIFIKSFWG
ncbi:Putative Mn2+ efflux pump MntP [Butyrivibrio proteoclasticus]|uniref:Putative manganese efflux pump MntP n=1 Tax=Butyrivibrio proteoclasticus TaxID=43305 RepID=A0A1I5QZX8_9FIRM|nr:manganese efflux pump [Butyrivibrio proteoclasticus]SFP51818.1 Putative Mn2+ efflux pump MntP [Butyrivibrio proteoclasticus]